VASYFALATNELKASPMGYNRANLSGESLAELRDYVLSELDQVQKAFAILDFLRLKIWHNEPPRVYDGLVVVADGSDWKRCLWIL